jgi:hypothetical protein
MMASRRQIEANRRNARKSTGPKSRAGKRRASRNAIRHGLHREIDKSEILRFYEKITAGEGFTPESLSTEPRARLAYRLAEAEARLAHVTGIENKVWQDLREEAAEPNNQKPISGKMSNEEWIDAIREELDVDLDPDEVKGGFGRTILSVYKSVLLTSRKKPRPSLVRRYRNEAEANRQRLLEEWIEGMDTEPCEFDEWFNPIYEEILAKHEK